MQINAFARNTVPLKHPSKTHQWQINVRKINIHCAHINGRCHPNGAIASHCHSERFSGSHCTTSSHQGAPGAPSVNGSVDLTVWLPVTGRETRQKTHCIPQDVTVIWNASPPNQWRELITHQGITSDAYDITQVPLIPFVPFNRTCSCLTMFQNNEHKCTYIAIPQDEAEQIYKINKLWTDSTAVLFWHISWSHDPIRSLQWKYRSTLAYKSLTSSSVEWAFSKHV